MKIISIVMVILAARNYIRMIPVGWWSTWRTIKKYPIQSFADNSSTV